MKSTYLSRKRTALVSWLSILVVLTSVVAWLPAAAQDATPEDEPAGQDVMTSQSTSDEENPGITSLDTQSVDTVIQSIAIQCTAVGSTTIDATLNVIDPQGTVVVDLQLVVGDTPVQEIEQPLNPDQTSYYVQFLLEWSDADFGDSVVVTAVERDSGDTEDVSASLPISQTSASGTVCGTVADPTATSTPVTPTATLTPTQTATTAPTQTPTATATATTDQASLQNTTSTATATATATATPSPTATATTAPTTLYGTVVNTGGADLRCRTSPVTGDIITLLAASSRVETRGDATDGWYPVRCAGADGWVSGEYFTVDNTPSDPAPDGNTQFATVTGTGGAGLRCRTAPVSGGIITVLLDGTRVEARGGVADGWLPVECAGQAGWMAVAYLQVESAPTTPDEPSNPGTGTFATVYNTGGMSLRCRTAPVSGATITLLADGTQVETLGATVDGWVPVRCAGQDGWSSAEYLQLTGSNPSTPTPTPSPTPDEPSSPATGTFGTVVNTDGYSLRCRTEPENGSVITLLPPGTRVETLGATTNGWVPVDCASRDGWVSAAYFQVDGGSTPPPPTPEPGESRDAMVSGTGGAGLRCRTAPISGGTITVVQEGARIETRGATSNGWVPVTCAGQSGWVSSAYVLFDVAAGSGELWIDINLSTQYMRVFRGDTVIMQTYVSTGRPGFDTPTGTFYTNWKLPSQTMSGVLGGEYYYVPDVPWVMYFTNRGHAIHGAYWHNNFGNVMSHGCINLPVGTAAWLYGITPVGTRVRIHY